MSIQIKKIFLIFPGKLITAFLDINLKCIYLIFSIFLYLKKRLI